MIAMRDLNLPRQSLLHAAFSISISGLLRRGLKTEILLFLSQQRYFLGAFDVAMCPQQLSCFEEVSALLHTCRLTTQIIVFIMWQGLGIQLSLDVRVDCVVCLTEKVKHSWLGEGVLK